MSFTTPGADDLGFDLLPVEGGVSADLELAAAAAGLANDPDAPQSVASAPPVPFGYSWAFDYEHGRFVRQGGAPARVTGVGALAEWCLTARYTARYRHRVFSDQFGTEHPAGWLGQPGDEAVADEEKKTRDAWLLHPRISDVTFDGSGFDALTGVLSLGSPTVITDGDESVILPDLPLGIGD